MPICRVNDFEITDIVYPSKYISDPSNYISDHLILHFPFLPVNVKENCKKSLFCPL